MRDDYSEELSEELKEPEEASPAVSGTPERIPGRKIVARPAGMAFLRSAEKAVSVAGKVLAAVLAVIWKFLVIAGRGLASAGRWLRRFFKKDTVPNLVLVLTLVTVVIAVGLGVVYSVTEPLIAEARENAFNEAMGEVFPGAALTFTPLANLPNVYEGRSGGERVGFSVRVSPNGYSGPIEMIVGINMQLEVTGVVIVSQRETRGFDAKGRMLNDFTGQFTGLRGFFAVGQADGEYIAVDAVAGATVSSEAVTHGVNEALALLEGGIQEP